MPSILNEVSRKLPPGAKPPRCVEGSPILYAFGCALFENYDGGYFTYKAVNLENNNKTIIISKRKTPISPMDIDRAVERIRLSGIRGAARYEADRPYPKSITYNKCREILYIVFREVLPKYGYAVRGEQMALAEEVLLGIRDRKAILAEAEVGTGKTLAYLTAAVIAKRGRLNDFWNRSFYPEMSYADMAYMPIVIATSSIALQKAIIKDYIPELSDILMEHGIIRTPLTAVLRKGREHYVCDRFLRSHYEYEHDKGMKKVLKGLMKPAAPIDLAEITGLNPHAKRQIKVPSRCDENCPCRLTCRYLSFMDEAMDPRVDIQVTNHNYLIADTLHRVSEKRSLLPNYQSVIIDEAHKFLQAARSMYGTELSNNDTPGMIEYLSTVKFMSRESVRVMQTIVKKLYAESRKLFRRLVDSIQADTEDDAERYGVQIDSKSCRHLQNICEITGRLHDCLKAAPADERYQYRKTQLLWEIKNIGKRAGMLSMHRENICWLEKVSDKTYKLCAVPKDLENRLFTDIWSKRIPAVLTSGTLSAGGDFSHTKRTLGLNRLGGRVNETSKPSPFNHKESTLLYISETTPFPDGKDRSYIEAISDEIERLIKASHGHSAVLFTSYDTMGRVYAKLSARKLPFPLMRLERGSSSAIERFKKTYSSVLFASGALWEGIDIPGDTLSMLIIVKLPFQVPDSISEYEQTLYKNFHEYKNRVIVPEMLIKLKQGFGRLIRTETDTGCVAILDSRANIRGAYRERILKTLPKCRVTSRVEDVERFIRSKKPASYFM